MKILFVDNAGTLSAGAYHSLVSLVIELRRLNVESFIALPDKTDGLKILKENNISYISIRSCAYSQMIEKQASMIEKIKMPLKYIITRIDSYKLAKYIKMNNIDIVHDNTSVSYIGMYASKIAKVQHVWHIREFLEEDFGVEFWNKKMAIKLFNESNEIIGISEAICKKYHKLLPNKSIRLIYNGIDINKFYDAKKKILNINNDGIKIICVGRICEGKGQRLLIDAIGILKKIYFRRVYVKFAGSYDDEYLCELKEYAKQKDVLTEIEFLGQCNNISEIYKQCDVLCMTSKAEAFGRVTVEAMMAGLLIIGSDSGGTKEIIKNNETGLLFIPESPESLAEKINYVYTNKSRVISIAKLGQDYAIKNFSSKKNALEILKIYENLMGEN